jgi:hypothetical protein
MLLGANHDRDVGGAQTARPDQMLRLPGDPLGLGGLLIEDIGL